MSRCTHPRVMIIEFGTSTTSHVRHHDGSYNHESDFGDYSGVIKVDCLDCKLLKVYRSEKQYPQWLRAYLKEINDGPDG